MERLGKLALERLVRYYRFLTESKAKKPLETITSAQIAEALDIDPTQVRKDLGAIGLVGMGRVGFDVCEVCRGIRVSLGFDQPYDAVLIGTGHLGGAILAYAGFQRYGLNIVAAFDNDKDRAGSTVAGCPVKPMRALKPFIKSRVIRLAILTVPADVAQSVTDRVVAAGIEAIWNFSPTQLIVPEGVFVRNEHISVGLSEIAYHLRR